MSTQNIVTTPASTAARRKFDVRDFGILAGLLLIVVYLSLATDTFLTQGNLVNLLDQAVIVGLLAAGATMCIVSGVFDLSSSANLALSAIAGVFYTQHFGVFFGFILALVTGLMLGAITGFLIVTTKVNSFIGSLAVSIIYRGLATVVTAGLIVSPLPEQLDAFRFWTRPFLFNLSGGAVLLIAVTIIFAIILWRTTFGRRVYAVGGNIEAARLSGIRTNLIHISVFALSGLTAAAAGMVLASRAGSAQPAMAMGVELTAIAAVVIGGTSIMGGVGAVWRTAVGVIILTIIGNGFNLLGWDTTYQQVVTGVLILLAVAADSLLFRRTRAS